MLKIVPFFVILWVTSCKPVPATSSLGVLSEVTLTDAPYPPFPVMDLRIPGFGLSATTPSTATSSGTVTIPQDVMESIKREPVKNPLDGWGGWKPVAGSGDRFQGQRVNGDKTEYYETVATAGPNGQRVWSTTMYNDPGYIDASTHKQLQFQVGNGEGQVWASRPVTNFQEGAQSLFAQLGSTSQSTSQISNFIDGSTSFQSREGNYFLGQSSNTNGQSILQFRPLGADHLSWQPLNAQENLVNAFRSGNFYQRQNAKEGGWVGLLQTILKDDKMVNVYEQPQIVSQTSYRSPPIQQPTRVFYPWPQQCTGGV